MTRPTVPTHLWYNVYQESDGVTSVFLFPKHIYMLV